MSLCVAVCTSVCLPLCVPLYPYVSLCVFMYLYAPVCAYEHPSVPVYDPVCAYVPVCVSVTYLCVCVCPCMFCCLRVPVCTYVPVCIFVCTRMHVQLCSHACICLGVHKLSGAPDTWACVHANVHEWGWGTGGKTIFLEALLDRLPSYLYCHVNQIFSGSPPRSLGALSPPGCEPQTRLPNR